jgi:hypothetical protein
MLIILKYAISSVCIYCTVRSESRCALRLRYVDLVVSIEVAVQSVLLFHCIQLLNSG